MSAVLDGIKAFRNRNPQAQIIVKLLLSIDRRNDTEAALDTVSSTHVPADSPVTHILIAEYLDY